jgi:hypothetical protein
MLCDVVAHWRLDRTQRGRLPHLRADRRLVGFRSFAVNLPGLLLPPR